MKPIYRLLILVALLAVLGGIYLLRDRRNAQEAAQPAAQDAAMTVVDDGPAAEMLVAGGVQLFLDNGEAWKAGVLYHNQGPAITKVTFTAPESITEAQVDACGKLSKLSLVSCFELPVTKDHLGILSRLTRNVTLDLNYTGVTDEELPSLESCRSLTGLLLNGSRITDEGISRVAGWPSLHTLTLYDTAVSDQGLDRLSASTSLRILDVQRTRVTLAGVARFRQALPTCFVYCDPY